VVALRQTIKVVLVMALLGHQQVAVETRLPEEVAAAVETPIHLHQ
jgi:hypothetical protein